METLKGQLKRILWIISQVIAIVVGTILLEATGGMVSRCPSSTLLPFFFLGSLIKIE